MVDALKACSAAGDFQTRHVGLAWMRSRIAANQENLDETFHWLELVLDLEPATPTESSYFEEVIPFGTDGLLMSVLSDGLGVELWSWTPAAGAQLVQLYSGLIYSGPSLVRECADALRA